MTQLELWQKLQQCIKENGKFPSAHVFAAYSGIREEVVYRIFKKWAEEGKLVKRGSHYRSEDEEYKPTVKEIPQLVMKGNNMIIKKIVSALSLMIGLILTVVSIHFTFEFNKLSLPSFWAFLLSASVVLFMNLAFVVRSLMKNPIKKQIIVFLWFLGIVYSVFTAVSGQFNDQRKYTSLDNSSKSSKIESIYSSELSDLQKKQKALLHWRTQEETYSWNPDLKVENPGTWKTIRKGVNELEEAEKKISELNEKIRSNINNVSEENKSVFSWIQSITGISNDLIQFFIILFPSLFIDLCSTVLIDFALGKKNG